MLPKGEQFCLQFLQLKSAANGELTSPVVIFSLLLEMQKYLLDPYIQCHPVQPVLLQNQVCFLYHDKEGKIRKAYITTDSTPPQTPTMLTLYGFPRQLWSFTEQSSMDLCPT